MFGLRCQENRCQKAFMPRLKIELMPYPLIKVQITNPFHCFSSSQRLQPPFSLLSLSETTDHHGATTQWTPLWPLLRWASTTLSSPLPATVVPPFLVRGKFKMRSFFFFFVYSFLQFGLLFSFCWYFWLFLLFSTIFDPLLCFFIVSCSSRKHGYRCLYHLLLWFAFHAPKFLILLFSYGFVVCYILVLCYICG